MIDIHSHIIFDVDDGPRTFGVPKNPLTKQLSSKAKLTH